MPCSPYFHTHADADGWYLLFLFQPNLMLFYHFPLLSPSIFQSQKVSLLSYLYLFSPARLSPSEMRLCHMVQQNLGLLYVFCHYMLRDKVLDWTACLSDGHCLFKYPSGDKRLSSVRNVLWDCSAFLPALRWDTLTSSQWNFCLCASSPFPLRLLKTSTSSSSSSSQPAAFLCHRLLLKQYNDV